MKLERGCRFELTFGALRAPEYGASEVQCRPPESGIFRSMGENGGQFFGLHMIAVDSFRVQRFVPADSRRGRLLQQLAEIQ